MDFLYDNKLFFIVLYHKILKKLKNNLEFNIEEMKELCLYLPNETSSFIRECLEKKIKC